MVANGGNVICGTKCNERARFGYPGGVREFNPPVREGGILCKSINCHNGSPGLCPSREENGTLVGVRACCRYSVLGSACACRQTAVLHPRGQLRLGEGKVVAFLAAASPGRHVR